MRIPNRLRERLLAVALRTMHSRKPDFLVGDPDNPYLRRWHWLPRNNFFCIYFHHLLRDDDPRALHDHPGHSCSILLHRSYLEKFKDVSVIRREGDVAFRRAPTGHRLELFGAQVITIFIVGPKYREWGFHCPKGWVHWKKFVANTRSADGVLTSTVGAGCGED